MTVLTVLAVLESTLPSFFVSYKIQHNEATMAVWTVLAVSVMTAAPVKLNPPCRDPSMIFRDFLRQVLCPISDPSIIIVNKIFTGLPRDFFGGGTLCVKIMRSHVSSVLTAPVSLTIGIYRVVTPYDPQNPPNPLIFIVAPPRVTQE